MDIKKKIIDFIVLEDNNVGRKAVITTGVLRASTVLASVLAPTAIAEAGCQWGPHCNFHTDSCWLYNHVDQGGWFGTPHTNQTFCYGFAHTNDHMDECC